jgi:indolepyruvate ferredoxin oxidoreductase
MGVGAATAILSAAGREMGYHVQFIRHNGVAVRTGGVYSQLVYTRSESDNHLDSDHTSTTAAIPYGQCDLILGFDLLEAVRAIDPAHRYRVASPDTTGAVINTAATPTVDQLLGQAELDPAQLDRTLRRYTKPDQYVGFNVAALSERLLGSKRFVNVMLLGVAYQRGLLPLTHEALEKAIRHLFPDEAALNLQAFIIGRQIVVEPKSFNAHTTPAPTLRNTYVQKVLALQARYSGSKGRLLAKQFRQLVRQMRRAGKSLQADEKLARDAILRAYDCMVWGGIDYVHRYCTAVIRIAKLDDAEHGYQLTRAVVWQLAHVMLIKDEVYVSALLTSPEKYQRDRQRFNIDAESGDQIHYRHYHQPEFVLFGRHFRFEWASRDWQLRLMARMRWLRRLMPGWHRREQRYRDWYLSLVEQVDWQPGGSPREYQRWLAILQTPETVSGYREVWYPRMEAARRQAEQLLETDPQLFEPPAAPTSAKRVSLPIVTDL